MTGVTLKRISATDFDKLAAQTKLGTGAEMARSVLVDGESQKVVALRHGVTRQRVGLAVDVIRKVYEAKGGTRSAQLVFEGEMPEGLTTNLSLFIDRLSRKGLSRDQKACAVSAVSQALARATAELDAVVNMAG